MTVWFWVFFFDAKKVTGLVGRVFCIKRKPWEYSTIIAFIYCSFGFTGATFADVWPGLSGARFDDAFGLSEKKGSSAVRALPQAVRTWSALSFLVPGFQGVLGRWPKEKPWWPEEKPWWPREAAATDSHCTAVGGDPQPCGCTPGGLSSRWKRQRVSSGWYQGWRSPWARRACPSPPGSRHPRPRSSSQSRPVYGLQKGVLSRPV